MLSGDQNTHGQCFQLIWLHLLPHGMIAAHPLGLETIVAWLLKMLSNTTDRQVDDDFALIAATDQTHTPAAQLV